MSARNLTTRLAVTALGLSIALGGSTASRADEKPQYGGTLQVATVNRALNVLSWDPADWNWKLNDPPGRGEPKDTAVFRNNLYWPTDGKKPALLTKAHYTWDEWRKLGRDSGTIFADPMFEDIAKRMLQLRT